MSSSNRNLVSKVMIGDGANSAAITDLSAIAKGDLFLVSGGVPITTVTAAQALAKNADVFIASGLDAGYPLISGKINGANVKYYKGQSTVAKVNKQITLGYNGTASTSIAVSAGSEYKLKVKILDSHRPIGQRPTEWSVAYTAGTGETLQTVVSKLAILWNAEEYGTNYMKDVVKLERVSNGSRSAFTGNVTVINGAKLVTVALAHSLTVGAVVKFQGKAYVVAEVPSTTTLRLDVPYQGVSETILATDTDTGSYGTVTEWGFLLTGVDVKTLASRAANEPYDQYEFVNFEAYLTDTEDYTALKTLTTALNPGQGYWKQVAQAEEWAKGYNGDSSKTLWYDKRIDSQVAVDTYYDSVKIEYITTQEGSLETPLNHPCLVEIYIPDGGDQGDDTAVNNEFLAVLNGYFADVLGFPAISF